MTEVIEYQVGEYVRLSNAYIDEDGNDYDPDTIEIKIYDPLNVLKTTVTFAAGEIIKDSEGHYHYDYTIPADGAIGGWIARWTAVTDTLPTIDPNMFYVVAVDDRLYCTAEQAVATAGMDETASGSTRAEVRNFIRSAMGDIDEAHQRTYSHANDATEWFDVLEPDGRTRIDTIFLNHRPIQTITSLEEYNCTNVLVRTHEADDYWTDFDTGRIMLGRTAFSHQAHRIKCVYTHGYHAVPTEINSLASVIAALSILDAAIGGSTSDVTNYTVGGMSVAIGETYAVMRVAREKLVETYKRKAANIGNRKGDILIA